MYLDNLLSNSRVLSFLERGQQPRLTHNPQVTFEARVGPSLAAGRVEFFEKTKALDNTGVDSDARVGAIRTAEDYFEFAGDSQLGVLVQTSAVERDSPEVFLTRIEPGSVRSLELIAGADGEIQRPFYFHFDRAANGAYFASPVEKGWLEAGKA